VHPMYDNFGEPVDRLAARRELGIDPTEKVLLFFGFIRRYKGLHVLLEAMPGVAARVPGVKLIVAGECYGDEAEYRDAIGRSPEGVIRWDSEYIPDDRVAQYFSATDVVVQPYVSATQSGVAQIAYHFEKPMIVTDVGGLAEIVPDGEAGLVVPPDDAAALGNAIVSFFERALGGTFAAGVRRGKKRFGWGPLYEAVEELMTQQVDDS